MAPFNTRSAPFRTIPLGPPSRVTPAPITSDPDVLKSASAIKLKPSIA